MSTTGIARSRRRPSSLLHAALSALIVLAPEVALAEEPLADEAAPPAPARDALRNEVSAAVGASNFGGRASLGYRLVWPSGAALGVSAVGAHGQWFVGGLPSDEATTVGGAVIGELPAVESEARRFVLRGALGARTTHAADLAEPDVSFVPHVEVGARAVVEATDDLEFVVGMAVPVAMAVDPEVEVEELGQVTEIGFDRWVSDRVAIGVLTRSGALYGYDGDGAKVFFSAELGVRFALDEPRRARVRPPRAGGVGAFVATEWRVMGLAGELGHGPGVAAGVSFFDGHLDVGLGAHNRPGPINPTTFRARPVGGATYKGRTELDLRSDGGLFGLFVSPGFDMPGLEALRVELPVIVGQAAYGFYLTGDDRKTPDGRRVSSWENELFAGRDSSPALGVDLGLQLGVHVPGARWLVPYVAAHYSLTPGFDTFVTDDYGGPSGALGWKIAM